MKKLILISALLGAMTFILSGSECAGENNATYFADLRPGHEVPPVTDAGQNGRAEIFVNEADRTIEASVTTNINTPGKLTAAHLHLGAAGSNGGVLFDLGAPVGSGFERTLQDEDMSAVGTVDTWNEFLTELKAGNVYVNVHTTDNPSGEIRGQL